MNWLLFAQLVVQVGLPAAERIFQKWQSGERPTQEDIDEIKEAANTTAVDRVKARLVAKGIPLDSDKAKEILAAVTEDGPQAPV